MVMRTLMVVCAIVIAAIAPSASQAEKRASEKVLLVDASGPQPVLEFAGVAKCVHYLPGQPPSTIESFVQGLTPSTPVQSAASNADACAITSDASVDWVFDVGQGLAWRVEEGGLKAVGVHRVLRSEAFTATGRASYFSAALARWRDGAKEETFSAFLPCKPKCEFYHQDYVRHPSVSRYVEPLVQLTGLTSDDVSVQLIAALVGGGGQLQPVPDSWLRRRGNTQDACRTPWLLRKMNTTVPDLVLLCKGDKGLKIDLTRSFLLTEWRVKNYKVDIAGLGVEVTRLGDQTFLTSPSNMVPKPTAVHGQGMAALRDGSLVESAPVVVEAVGGSDPAWCVPSDRFQASLVVTAEYHSTLVYDNQVVTPRPDKFVVSAHGLRSEQVSSWAITQPPLSCSLAGDSYQCRAAPGQTLQSPSQPLVASFQLKYPKCGKAALWNE